MTIPKPPIDLAAAGKALWTAMVNEYDLSASELTILLEACRTSDELARLAPAVSKAELVVAGSMQQPRANPLLDEARRHREVLARLLGQLKEIK